MGGSANIAGPLYGHCYIHVFYQYNRNLLILQAFGSGQLEIDGFPFVTLGSIVR